MHEKKRKHNQEQQASNLIVSELIKINKTAVFKETAKTVKSMKILISLCMLSSEKLSRFTSSDHIHVINLNCDQDMS